MLRKVLLLSLLVGILTVDFTSNATAVVVAPPETFSVGSFVFTKETLQQHQKVVNVSRPMILLSIGQVDYQAPFSLKLTDSYRRGRIVKKVATETELWVKAVIGNCTATDPVVSVRISYLVAEQPLNMQIQVLTINKVSPTRPVTHRFKGDKDLKYTYFLKGFSHNQLTSSVYFQPKTAYNPGRVFTNNVTLFQKDDFVQVTVVVVDFSNCNENGLMMTLQTEGNDLQQNYSKTFKELDASLFSVIGLSSIDSSSGNFSFNSESGMVQASSETSVDYNVLQTNVSCYKVVDVLNQTSLVSKNATVGTASVAAGTVVVAGIAETASTSLNDTVQNKTKKADQTREKLNTTGFLNITRLKGQIPQNTTIAQVNRPIVVLKKDESVSLGGDSQATLKDSSIVVATANSTATKSQSNEATAASAGSEIIITGVDVKQHSPEQNQSTSQSSSKPADPPTAQVSSSTRTPVTTTNTVPHQRDHHHRDYDGGWVFFVILCVLVLVVLAWLIFECWKQRKQRRQAEMRSRPPPDNFIPNEPIIIAQAQPRTVQLAEAGERNLSLSGDPKENAGREDLQTDERLRERMAKQAL